MLDWNSNGKIDPVDIGISIATEKEIESTKPKEENKNSNSGCLTFVLVVIGLLSFIIFFMF